VWFTKLIPTTEWTCMESTRMGASACSSCGWQYPVITIWSESQWNEAEFSWKQLRVLCSSLSHLKSRRLPIQRLWNCLVMTFTAQVNFKRPWWNKSVTKLFISLVLVICKWSQYQMGHVTVCFDNLHLCCLQI